MLPPGGVSDFTKVSAFSFAMPSTLSLPTVHRANATPTDIRTTEIEAGDAGSGRWCRRSSHQKKVCISDPLWDPRMFRERIHAANAHALCDVDSPFLIVEIMTAEPHSIRRKDGKE